MPQGLEADDVVGGMHSMSPRFLADQIERSRANLGVDTIDVFYLHNPETQLGFRTGDEFDGRIRRAFAQLERLADQGKIRWYGAATWDGFRKPGALSLPRLAAIATEEGGPDHHFRFIQLPFNLAMVEAYIGRPESVLARPPAWASRWWPAPRCCRRACCREMPEAVARLLPGLATNAQRAIQFTRSTPGITVALVGMGRRGACASKISAWPWCRPPRASQYARFYT